MEKLVKKIYKIKPSQSPKLRRFQVLEECCCSEQRCTKTLLVESLVNKIKKLEEELEMAKRQTAPKAVSHHRIPVVPIKPRYKYTRFP